MGGVGARPSNFWLKEGLKMNTIRRNKTKFFMEVVIGISKVGIMRTGFGFG
jgi:hypothetical protein